jgi:hypothetical protein
MCESQGWHLSAFVHVGMHSFAHAGLLIMWGRQGWHMTAVVYVGKAGLAHPDSCS